MRFLLTNTGDIGIIANGLVPRSPKMAADVSE